MPRRHIEVVNARQNNLKGVSVSVPIGAVTAVTGVAGAGKSSLAFDVLYAEGHRRYAETFSPYARQFLERLDRQRDGLQEYVAAVSRGEFSTEWVDRILDETGCQVVDD